MVALRIERDFTKQQILELYMNRIYFGSGCYGVETASLAYFGKNASKLNLSESAILAGSDSQPESLFAAQESRKAPRCRGTRCSIGCSNSKRSAPAQAQEAKLAKITSNPKRMPQIQENYAMDAVQRDLNLLLTPDQIDNGGLYIYTTLDPDGAGGGHPGARDPPEQDRAPVEFPAPAQGKLPAAGGRRRFFDALPARGAWWRSTTRAAAFGHWSAAAITRRASSIAPWRRRTGRSVHPSSHLSMRSLSTHGLLPGAAVSDGPIEPGEIPGAGNWAPGNSDGTYTGIQPVSYGLVHSRNTMSVRIGEIAGIDDVQKDRDDARAGRKHSARPGDFHRFIRNQPEGSHRGLQRFSKRRGPKAGLHHRADRRSGSQPDLPRGACHDSRARSRARPG